MMLTPLNNAALILNCLCSAMKLAKVSLAGNLINTDNQSIYLLTIETSETLLPWSSSGPLEIYIIKN